jgi:hypothetical protein
VRQGTHPRSLHAELCQIQNMKKKCPGAQLLLE